MSTPDEHRHPLFARAWTGVLGDNAMGWGERAALVDGLAGRVLEVGAGDGRTFEHYDDAVTEVIAVEPEPTLRAAASARRIQRVTVVGGVAEALPAGDGSVDAVVACLVLCSVASQRAALAEIARVLAPGGELRFYEHVAATRPLGRATQRALDGSGIWPRLAAGCHLARDTEAAIRAAGFTLPDADLRRFRVSLVPHVAGRALRA